MNTPEKIAQKLKEIHKILDEDLLNKNVILLEQELSKYFAKGYKKLEVNYILKRTLTGIFISGYYECKRDGRFNKNVD